MTEEEAESRILVAHQELTVQIEQQDHVCRPVAELRAWGDMLAERTKNFAIKFGLI